MVKGDVAALVGKPGFSLLNGMVQDFVHPGDVGAGGNDRRQVLQSALEGVVEPGYHQQEQEEGQHVQAALHQQDGARQGHGGYAQAQNERGGHHKGRQAKLIDDGAALHGANLLFQHPEEFLFRVVGLQVLQRFDALLNAVRAGHFGVHGFLIEPFLHPGGEADNGKGHGHHPQGGQRHAPVVEEQARRHQQAGKDGAGQLRDEVRKALFQERAVGHDGAGQVGQVLLSEEGQGELPQPFRQGNPPHAAFGVGGKVGGVVLYIGGQQNQPHADRAADGIEGRPAFGNAAAHQVTDQAVEQSYRKHKGNVLQDAGYATLYQIPGALLGEGVALLQPSCHLTAPPSAPSIERKSDNPATSAGTGRLAPAAPGWSRFARCARPRPHKWCPRPPPWKDGGQP